MLLHQGVLKFGLYGGGMLLGDWGLGQDMLMTNHPK